MKGVAALLLRRARPVLRRARQQQGAHLLAQARVLGGQRGIVRAQAPHLRVHDAQPAAQRRKDVALSPLRSEGSGVYVRFQVGARPCGGGGRPLWAGVT